MRGKRSKQYRKLMQQYSLTFGFREPYQVLVDAEMIYDAHRFAMDLPASLARTLHGNVKVMITSCSIRHLFALPTSSNAGGASPEPKSASQPPNPPPTDSAFPTAPVSSQTKTDLLAVSRSLTLRKCNHHTLDAPLSAFDCLRSVLDPKGNGVNKHRLVLAAQDSAVRQWARQSVRGVPSIYVKRSVMVMEPMSALSEQLRAGEEMGKLRGPLPPAENAQGLHGKKRDREEDDTKGPGQEDGAAKVPAKKRKGPKGPNPLSVKKKKPKAVKAKDSTVTGEA